MPDDFEEYYNKYIHKFPPEIAASFDKGYDTLYFAFNIYKYLMEVLPPKLHALMVDQHPVMTKHDNPILTKYMKDINVATTYGLAVAIAKLRLDDINKVDQRKQYPKFEQWKKFYASPPQPKTTSDEDRKYYSYINSDEEWQAFKKEEDASSLRFFNWQEKRKTEFYNVVQPILFDRYEWMRNFEPDTWIIYAMHIRDEYENWKSESERVEEILDYNLPYECINQDFTEYIHLLEEAYEKDPEDTIRQRRIAGEKI
ncbi:MAG: hypothetical protein H7Y00_02755 [Fimbriimonadaceae bacterium]|nr:hypothetical protein [Chitinophagales bacterium]